MGRTSLRRHRKRAFVVLRRVKISRFRFRIEAFDVLYRDRGLDTSHGGKGL
jgi:hypothetical protein